jgi:flagellar biosynthesis/type III secretory pathway chaperone
MNQQMTIEPLVEKLLGALDQETACLRASTDHLVALNRLILKRDVTGLNSLLEQIRIESAIRDSNEINRDELMMSLASVIGCQISAVTLSMLERLVPTQQPLLQQKRTQLRRLIDELRKQHYSTSMLLGEMIRINRSLLAGITGRSDSMTYGRGGRTTWAGADNILNLRY